MSAPAFAVLGASQKPIDDLGESVRRVVGQEGALFGGRGRQTDEIERDAAQQGAFVGRRRGSKSSGFETGQHEGVNGRADPVALADGGDRLWADGLKRPVVLSSGGDGFAGADRAWHRLPEAAGEQDRQQAVGRASARHAYILLTESDSGR